MTTGFTRLTGLGAGHELAIYFMEPHGCEGGDVAHAGAGAVRRVRESP